MKVVFCLFFYIPSCDLNKYTFYPADHIIIIYFTWMMAAAHTAVDDFSILSPYTNNIHSVRWNFMSPLFWYRNLLYNISTKCSLEIARLFASTKERKKCNRVFQLLLLLLLQCFDFELLPFCFSDFI